MIIARTESEEKALLVGESGLFLTLGSGTSSVPYRSKSKNESNRIVQLKLSLSKQRAPVLGQGTAGAVYWQEVSGVSTVRLLAAGL